MCWYFSIRIISFHQAETSTSSEPTATKKRTAERNDARQKEDIVDSSNKRSNRAAPTKQPAEADDEDSDVADAFDNKRKKVAPAAKSAPKAAPSSTAGKSLKQTKLTDAVASTSSRRILR
jgi:hypothetical protein